MQSVVACPPILCLFTNKLHSSHPSLPSFLPQASPSTWISQTHVHRACSSPKLFRPGVQLHHLLSPATSPFKHATSCAPSVTSCLTPDSALLIAVEFRISLRSMFLSICCNICSIRSSLILLPVEAKLPTAAYSVSICVHVDTRRILEVEQVHVPRSSSQVATKPHESGMTPLCWCRHQLAHLLAAN